MTNKDFLANAKVGSIITNKQILSALKKRGLIFDYSEYGYLESIDIYYEGFYWETRKMFYLFSKGNAPKDKDLKVCYRKELALSKDESIDKFAYYENEIEYMGCKFRTKYLDGCFNAYLQLVEKNGNKENEVNPRMSLWGSVI